MCEEKADRIYAEIVLICMIQTTFIQKIIITSKNMTNERTVNRIDDKRLKKSKINYHLGNFQARNI